MRIRCFRPLLTGLVMVGAVLGATGAAFADSPIVASSTFDSDSEGWVVKDLAFPNPGAPPVAVNTFTPVYQNTGGNPGGHLSLVDPTANARTCTRRPSFSATDMARTAAASPSTCPLPAPACPSTKKT